MPVSAVFWIFLLIVMVIAFFMFLPKIKNLNLTQKTTETEQQQEKGTGNREQVTEVKKPQTEKPAAPEQKEPEKKPQTEKPVAEKTAAPEQKEPEKKPQAEKPATQPSTVPAQSPTPPVKPAETSGSIYLIKESNKMLVKVNRNINPNKPLTDSINALLAGPAPDEIMSGIKSFVPEGSRLLNAEVKGSTARLSFNQEFRYNQEGREGCEGQIKQIVWTATEIPEVQNVQFLIDGKEVDFLSEGVVIRKPIGR